MSGVTATELRDAISHTSKSKAIPTLLSLSSLDTDDCIEWPFGRDRDGYGVFYLSPNGDRRQRKTSANRAVSLLTFGDPPADGMHAAHSCHNRSCINPRHLRWATVQENIDDREARRHTFQPHRKGQS